jgi:hypothetical protein
MFKGILDEIIRKAEELNNDLNKNLSDFNEIFNDDLYNYRNISITDIDKIKQTFLEDITYYFEYSQLNNIFDYINNSNNNLNNTQDEQQLINILNEDNYNIFKLKRLFDVDIQKYLIDIDNQIKKEFYTLFERLNIFDIKYSNNVINDFINDIKNHDNNDNNDNNDVNVDVDVDVNVDVNVDDIINKINEIFEIIKDDNNIDYKFIDNKTTIWNDSVIIYKIINIKTYEYKIVYFDLFKRKNKTETNTIIKLSKNNLCINKNYEYIKDNQILELKNLIINIIN